MTIFRKSILAGIAFGLAVWFAAGPAGAAGSKTIRVGMLQMLTGDLSRYGIPLRDGALMAVDEINAAGGINGRKIEVFLEDAGSSPQGSVQAALKLIQRDKVDIIMQGGTSGHTLATIPLVDEHGVAMLNMSTSEAITKQGSKWTFRAARVPNSVLDRKYAEYVVKEMGLKRIALIYGNDEMGRDASSVFLKGLAEQGVTPVANEQVQPGDPDVSAQVTLVKSTKPEAIFVQGHTNETTKILRTLKQMLTSDFTLLGFDQMATDKYVEEAGGCANVKGMYYRTGILGEKSKNADLHAFVKRWKAKHPDVDPFLPMINFAGMEVMFEGLRLAGDNLSRQGIRDAFYKVQGFQSIFGTIDVQKNGETMNIVHIMKMDDQCKPVLVKENY